MIRMVVFDMDDTLYPEIQFVRGGFEAAAEHLDLAVGRETGACELFMAILAENGTGRVFDQGLERLGIEASPGLIAGMVQAYRGHAPVLAPFPGVPELLDDLRGQGLRIGLITDGPLAVQRSKFAALGLASRFDVTVFSDAIAGRASWKPSPLPFREVERLSGFSGPSLIYIGDNPAKDFQGAEACGWLTVRARYPGTIHAGVDDKPLARPEVTTIAGLRETLLGI